MLIMETLGFKLKLSMRNILVSVMINVMAIVLHFIPVGHVWVLFLN